MIVSDLQDKCPETKAILHCGDSIQFLDTIPLGSIKLQITSPPYNIGKEYESRSGLQEYLSKQTDTIKKMVSVCHPNGSICWQVGNYIEDGEVFPLDFMFYDIFKNQGMKLRNRIVWRFDHGLHAKQRFSGRYEVLLWFTQGDDYTFNLDPVRVPSKYPGKRHYKGDKKGELSGNPLGKNPGDIWEIVQSDWDAGVWEIPNVKSNHVEKTAHPCQFPVELVERCVLALTNAGDMVFDPYSGVGSTAIAAVKHGRLGIGSELVEKYHEIATGRVQSLLEGTLRTRPVGKPVHVPSGKLAATPKEWS